MLPYGGKVKEIKMKCNYNRRRPLTKRDFEKTYELIKDFEIKKESDIEKKETKDSNEQVEKPNESI